jgi:UDP-N-acetylglucosamine--N-acetylmuramyl-(pentapeptide) pyrophosphoryl-undecaprenol N-acetylglucosamine transferase
VVLWLSGRDIESVSVSGWEGPVVFVGGKGLPKGFSPRLLSALGSMFTAFLKCLWLMMKHKPDIMLAMGGYASVGPVLAARVYKVPVVLHESNAIPGRAVRVLSRFAAVVAVSFASSARGFQRCQTVLTGFPLREDLKKADEDPVFSSKSFTVLVMGGSQGAHRLNEVVSEAICSLHRKGIPVQVIHLAGFKDQEFVRNVYEKAGVPNTVFGFLNEMSRAYGQADVAIARAGAATCAELVASGVPSILVPLPTAMYDHQSANARALVETGGACMVAEKDLAAEVLAERLRELYRNPEKLDVMRDALKRVPVSDAAAGIADLLEKTAAL